jgi:hypothetical protein
MATIVSRMKRAVWICRRSIRRRFICASAENSYGTAEVMPVISTNVVQGCRALRRCVELGARASVWATPSARSPIGAGDWSVGSRERVGHDVAAGVPVVLQHEAVL